MAQPRYVLRLAALVAATILLSSVVRTSVAQPDKAGQGNKNDPRYYVYVSGIT